MPREVADYLLGELWVSSMPRLFQATRLLAETGDIIQTPSAVRRQPEG